MRLTKKMTLELTMRLFKWLHRYPHKHKPDWPGWEKNGGTFKDVNSDCFCCEYVFEVIGESCTECPLSSLWPEGCISSKNSPYLLWICAGKSEDRRKYAKQIVDFCKKELAK